MAISRVSPAVTGGRRLRTNTGCIDIAWGQGGREGGEREEEGRRGEGGGKGGGGGDRTSKSDPIFVSSSSSGGDTPWRVLMSVVSTANWAPPNRGQLPVLPSQLVEVQSRTKALVCPALQLVRMLRGGSHKQ